MDWTSSEAVGSRSLDACSDKTSATLRVVAGITSCHSISAVTIVIRLSSSLTQR